MLRSKRLQEFKLGLKSDDVNDIDVVNQASQLGLLNFRSYLNLAMLLTESERTKTLPKVQVQMIHLYIVFYNTIAKS